MAQSVYDRVTGEGSPWGMAPNDNAKQWDKVLILPGRRGQSAEANELQSILEYYARLHAEAFFREGDVVAGCQLAVEGTAATVTAGRIFVAGKVREVPGTSAPLTLSGVGDESIGLKWTRVTITEAEDSDLLDPAEGWRNFSQPGAWRRKYEFEWRANDPTALTIFTLRNGQPNRTPLQPEASNFEKTLARRTFNESGHYLARRITSAISRSTVDSVFLQIPGFVAYVQGYEVVRLAGSELEIPIARDTAQVAAEQHTFNSGTDTYTLNGTPVAQVGQVSAVVQVTQSIVRGPIVNTPDLLPHTPVVSVVSVTQGMTTYNSPADFIVVGDNIDWSPAGAEPAVGSTYSVTWRYVKTLVPGVRTLTTVAAESRTRGLGDNDGLGNADGAEIVAIDDTASALDNPTHPYALNVDYELRATPTGSEIHWITANRPANGATYYVRYKYWAHTVEGDYTVRNSFSDPNHTSLVQGLRPVGGGAVVKRRDLVDFRAGGDNPVHLTTFTVTYSFYLSKWYVTYLSKDGEITLLSGESARNDPQVPSVPENVLPLERIFAPADSADMIVVEYNIVAVTMVKLNQLIRRVERSEYNIAQEDLDNEANDRQQATGKIGIFTDAFLGRTKMDIGAAGFAASINPRKGELILPRDYQYPTPVVNVNATDAELWEKVATLPHTEYTIAEQLLRTGERNVNDALQFKRPVARLSLNPHEDLWVDYDITSEILATQDHTLWLNQQTHVIQGVTDRSGGITTISPQELNRILQSIQAASEVVGRTEPAEFCRVRTVRASGSGFAGAENIALYFDGRRVTPTPIVGSAGDYAQSLKADAEGNWEADFTIPAQVPAGAKIVSAVGESGQEAHAIYGAYGSTRTFAITTRIGLPLLQFNNTVVQHQLPPPQVVVQQVQVPVIVDRANMNGGCEGCSSCCDPVAETIDFEQDTIVKGVELEFSAVPADPNALVEVRFMETGANGLITGAPSMQLGSRIVKASEIVPGTLKRFNFHDPIVAQQGKGYAFMVYSPTAGFKIRIAQHGKFDLNDPTKVVGLNPFINGIFLYSTNGRTWSAEQDVDLTFRLIGAQFTPHSKKILQFQEMSFGGIHRLALQAAQQVPSGSLIEWQYSPDGGDFLPLALGLENKFAAETDKVVLRAVLQTTNPRTSPVVDFTSVFVEGIENLSPGRYVSRTVTFPENFDEATIWLKVDRLSPTTEWTVFAFDEDTNDYVQLAVDDSRIIDDEFVENQYIFTPGAPQNTLKILIDFETSNLVVEPRAKDLMSVVLDTA